MLSMVSFSDNYSYDNTHHDQLFFFLLHRPIGRLLRYQGNLEGGIGLVIGAGKFLLLIICDNIYVTTPSAILLFTTYYYQVARQEQHVMPSRT